MMNSLPILAFTATVLWLFSRRKKLNPREASPSETSNDRAAPGADNPDHGPDRVYDVFLNFRGPDSRHTVANVLYNSLTRAGFRVFLDDEEIRKGEVIEGELLRAITNSRFYIPIFSKDYASSKWCLRELAKMIACWESSSGNTKKVILPIFYDVDVSEDIKLRSQVYTTALRKHKDELGEDIVKPWEDALRTVAKIKGWSLEDHGLSELADLINKEVFSKLTTTEAIPGLLDHLVGIDEPIEDILELLEEGSPGVRFIVIHGMGGIGKTTLANAIFKKISSRYQGSCFLKDIRKSSSDHDVIKLQEKLLSDTLSLNFIKVSDINDGIDMISKRLCNRDVLIVLDDVDKRDHLLNLASKSFWFGARSRIIITTRTIEHLPSKDDKEYCFYEMKEMDWHHALQLFCRHAFEKDRPPLEFHDISTEIVATTGGLPLSLQVIGSSLYNQDDGIWKFRLEKLKVAPHKNVQETLMISYQALEYEQQQIFLDIASLFNDKKMTYPFYFWEACKLYPDSSIKILVRRSLIKVYGDKLWMHDQLRDLGRAIAQPNKPCPESEFPLKPSRLWSPECALDALQKQEVAHSVMAIKLGTLNANHRFVPEDLARANNLKFLEMEGGNFEGDFKNVLQQLKWLCWFDCPSNLEATSLSFKNLVILKLGRSEIDEDWGGWCILKESKHLKVLHIKDFKRLKRTPNFSSWMPLERLVIRRCSELEEIDISIKNLRQLKWLEISNEINHLENSCPPVPARPQLLQGFIGDLKSLEALKINNAGLVELHPSIGEQVHLKLLHLRGCHLLEYLPNSIGKLTSLVEMDLSMSGIKELPDSIGDLKYLNILRMSKNPIQYLPDTIGGLESLKELYLNGTRIFQLPETIGNLKRLKVIDVSFSMIKMLPKALLGLENLESLVAGYCEQMDGDLPEEIGKLSRLRILQLSSTTISRVPKTLSQLSHLQQLILHGIHEPRELSNLPTSLTSLSVVSSSLVFHQVPDLSYMTNLEILSLINGSGDDSHWPLSPLHRAPQIEWLARLNKLEQLMLYLPDLVLPPTELSSLSRLRSLAITCFDTRSLPPLSSNLYMLYLTKVKLPIDWQRLSSFDNLSFLMLIKCWLTEIKVDCLEYLRDLSLLECKFLERLSNLSCLKELRYLYICSCQVLVDIEGLGELKSLQSLQLISCDSVRLLPDLSRLKKLAYLYLSSCESLIILPDVDEEVPCQLHIANCYNFFDFQGPYSEYRRHHANKLKFLREWESLIGDGVPLRIREPILISLDIRQLSTKMLKELWKHRGSLSCLSENGPYLHSSPLRVLKEKVELIIRGNALPACDMVIQRNLSSVWA